MKSLRRLHLALLMALAALSPGQARKDLHEARTAKAKAQAELRMNRAVTAETGEQLERVQTQADNAALALAGVRKGLAAETARATKLGREVVRARAQVAVRRKALAKRLRAMYVAGTPPPALVLLTSRSVGDLSVRRDLLRRVAARDRAETESLVRWSAYLARREDESRATAARIREFERRGANYKAGLEGARRAKEGLLSRLQNRQDELKSAIAQFDEDERRISAAIAAYEARRAAEARRRAEARAAARRQVEAERREEERREAEARRRGVKPAHRRVPVRREPPPEADVPEPRFNGDFGHPTDGPITSGFGRRFHPILHIWRNHDGIDFGGGFGAPVHAAAGGVVVAAETLGGYGRVVILDHGDGVSTVYGHLSAFAVSAGDRVRRGQRLGAIGSSGLSTGPHLHFEVHVHGRKVDPARYF